MKRDRESENTLVETEEENKTKESGNQTSEKTNEKILSAVIVIGIIIGILIWVGVIKFIIADSNNDKAKMVNHAQEMRAENKVAADITVITKYIETQDKDFLGVETGLVYSYKQHYATAIISYYCVIQNKQAEADGEQRIVKLSKGMYDRIMPGDTIRIYEGYSDFLRTGYKAAADVLIEIIPAETTEPTLSTGQ